MNQQSVKRALAMNQWLTLTRQGLSGEFSSPERILSPILFAVTLILILTFALGEPDAAHAAATTAAQVFVTTFFAVQLSYVRAFDNEEGDRVLDVLKTVPISGIAWFLSKFCQVFIAGIAIAIPTVFVGCLLGNQLGTSFLILSAATVLALVGLSSIGVLLATIFQRSTARGLVFPLLYFPLTVPVLLAAIEASKILMSGHPFAGDARNWAGLLVGFDVIYFVVGGLFFEEVIRAG